MINGILIGGIFLILAISVGWAMLRGLAKARIRGISMIACGVLAVLLALLTRSFLVTDTMMESNILPLLVEAEVDQVVMDVLGVSETLDDVLLNVCVSLILPVLTLVYFIVLSFLTWIAFLVLSIVFHVPLQLKSRFSPFRWLRSAAWGLGQGLVILFIVLLPISTYLSIAPTVVDEAMNADLIPSEQQEVVQDAMDDYVTPANSGVIKVYRALGGEALGNAMTDFTMNDVKVDFSVEIASVSSFGCDIFALSKTDFHQYGEKEALIFAAMAESFDDSVLLPTIAGEFIYNATQKWLAGEEFIGAAKPTFGDMNEIFDPFFTTLLKVLNEDSKNTAALQADIHTVADLVSTLARHGVFAKLSDTENLMTALSSNGIVESMVNSLGTNPSMKVLIPEITNMGIRAVATTLGIPANVEEVYGDFLNDVASSVNYAKALSGEVRAKQLSTDLEKAFDEAGIPIDNEIIDCYSVSMISDLIDNTEKDSITSQDVQAFFAVYALNATEATETTQDSTEGLAANGTLPLAGTDPFAGTVYEGKTEMELRMSGAAVLATAYSQILKLETENYGSAAAEILSNAYTQLLDEDDAGLDIVKAVALTKALDGDAYRATVALQAADGMITQKVTLDEMLVDAKTAADQINTENVAKEADAIASIFNAASELSREMNHSSDLKLDAVAGSFGSILDSLDASPSFGSDKTANLFTAVMQSETVRKTADIDMNTATQMAQKATEGENVNYSQTMNAVSSSVTVITKLGKDGEEVSEEELVELIRNINPQTAGMIEVYATPQKIESYKVSPKYSVTSSELICSTFHYMANAEMSEEQYQKEAKALNQILTVALSAKENSGNRHLFTKEGQTGVLPGNADETVETFMNSGAVRYGLVSTMLDENGNVKDGKFDAFELGAKLPQSSTDYQDCITAIDAYYAQHKDADTRVALLALAALLGVDATEVLA